MEHNDFQTNTTAKQPTHFPKHFRMTLYLSILLTGIVSIGGISFFFHELTPNAFESVGYVRFTWHIIFYLCNLCTFILLLQILCTKKPFNKTIVSCIKIISYIFLLASFLIPRLPDYTSSGLEIFAIGDFVTIDGNILIIGLIIYIFSYLIEEGFKMQNEIDEIM